MARGLLGTGTHQLDDSWTLGFFFSPKSAIVIDGLGFYDHGANGLSSSHRMGLWNNTLNTQISDTLITTANSSLAGPLINNAGQFRFVDIAPILAVPKYVYTVGGTILAGQTDAWYSAPMTVSSESFYQWDASLLLSVNGGTFHELEPPADLQYPYFFVGQRYGVVSLRARLASIADVPLDFPIIDLPDDFPRRQVPEPGMLALIGLGLAGLAFAQRPAGVRRLRPA
jgi:hypothetical protein